MWKRAHALTLRVYEATSEYPKHETYGLRSQIRRAMSSIPINLAEGSGRGSDAEFVRFIRYSIGSSTELEYEIRLSRDLGYMTAELSDSLRSELGEIRGMLFRLADRLALGHDS